MVKKKPVNTVLKVVGWLLVLITVGPVGLVGKELITLDEFSLAMLVPVGVFGLFFALGIWLIRRGKGVDGDRR